MTEILYVKDDEALSLYNMNCILERHVRYFRETTLDFKRVDLSMETVLHFSGVDAFRETTLHFNDVNESCTNRNIGIVVREDILDDILRTIDELKTEIEKLKKEKEIR